MLPTAADIHTYKSLPIVRVALETVHTGKPEIFLLYFLLTLFSGYAQACKRAAIIKSK